MTNVLPNPFATGRRVALHAAPPSLPVPVQVTVTDPRASWTVLVTEPLVVGRDSQGIRLQDAMISRRHVVLRPGPTSFTVEDLGSTNGSTLNGQPLRGQVVANPGDVVRLGQSTIVIDGPLGDLVAQQVAEWGAAPPGPQAGYAPPVHAPPAPPVSTIPRLVFTVDLFQPNGAVQRLTVDPQLTIGRSEVDVAVTDPTVSRQHLWIGVRHDQLIASDLRSTAGTTINWAPFTGEVVVRPGDQLRFGACVLVVVEGHYTPGAPPPGQPAPAAYQPVAQPPQPQYPPPAQQAPPGAYPPQHPVPAPPAAPYLAPQGPPPSMAAPAAAAPVAPPPEAPQPAPPTEPPVPDAADPLEATAQAPAVPEDAATIETGKKDKKKKLIPVSAEPLPPFPNYTQLPRRVPIGAWHFVRVGSVLVFLGLCISLFIWPDGGLFFFFRLLVPVLPVLLLVAPGLWRNICPLAAANQTPRLLGFTRGKTAPKWLRDRGGGYLIGVGLFLVIVASRKVLFNTNGPALALLLLAVIIGAFTGGFVYKGKSGWCSSHCPMLPVERMYGQTPFSFVPNSHCQPCVGCTKHCYDFNPGVAYQADMADPDPDWSAPRKFFAGALPGVILGFFAFPSPPAVSVPEAYVTFAIAALASVGLFFLLDAYTWVRTSAMAALFGASAFSLFYWYQSAPMVDAFSQVTHVSLTLLLWPIRVGAVLLAVAWLVRSIAVGRKFRDQSASPNIRLAAGATSALAGSGGEPEVRFVPDDNRVVAKAGQSILEVAEAASVPIEVGCRLGVCGADPVAIMEGMENLCPVTDEEADTLRRLGFASNTRMACCARIEGPVCVSITPEKAGTYNTGIITAPADPNLKKVVVIGNGIAGVTTADFVRRGHPDCEIHVIGREQHPLYNRMGIARLVYGRSAMQGLYLLDDDWYAEHDVTTWLNTHVSQISTAEKTVLLATGEQLEYDKLVLAMGSASTVLDVPGWGLPGCFVMREASDAIGIRDYLQRYGVRTAVVAGAGLLGLEAAHSLREFGVSVVVLDRGAQLMVKQSDPRCSELLGDYFAGLGITVTPSTTAAEIRGTGLVQGVLLSDGAWIDAGAFVVCAGITPNIELATAAGVACNRGVLVDEHMATNIPDVFAVGDLAEFNGQVPGLWPTAVSQAETAAASVLGRSEPFVPAPPAVILKGVGLDLVSVGRFTEAAGDETVIVDGPGIRYLKLVINQGQLCGAIVLGRPSDSPGIMTAVKKGYAIPPGAIERLRADDLTPLDPSAQPAPA